jgi:hypothetical protein
MSCCMCFYLKSQLDFWSLEFVPTSGTRTTRVLIHFRLAWWAHHASTAQRVAAGSQGKNSLSSRHKNTEWCELDLVKHLMSTTFCNTHCNPCHRQFIPITCGCTQYALRSKALDGDMSRYMCCQVRVSQITWAVNVLQKSRKRASFRLFLSSIVGIFQLLWLQSRIMRWAELPRSLFIPRKLLLQQYGCFGYKEHGHRAVSASHGTTHTTYNWRGASNWHLTAREIASQACCELVQITWLMRIYLPPQ